jgi:hypothetical protein
MQYRAHLPSIREVVGTHRFAPEELPNTLWRLPAPLAPFVAVDALSRNSVCKCGQSRPVRLPNLWVPGGLRFNAIRDGEGCQVSVSIRRIVDRGRKTNKFYAIGGAEVALSTTGVLGMCARVEIGRILSFILIYGHLERGKFDRGTIVIRRQRFSAHGWAQPLARLRTWAIAFAIYATLGPIAAPTADVKLANHQPLSPGYVPTPGVISLTYDVEAIGIPAVTARFDLTFGPDSYDMAVMLRTIGVIDWMPDWNMSMAARGALTSIALVPASYSEVQRKGGLTIVYAGGKIVSAPMTPPSVRNQDEEVTEAARTDAVDLLALVLATIRSINEGHGCDYHRVLYDGDHLFDLAVSPYTGSAPALMAVKGFVPPLACVFEFHKRAYQKKQNDPGKVIHEGDAETYRVWLSQISVDGPMVPIKFAFDSGIGVVRATLQQSGPIIVGTQEPPIKVHAADPNVPGATQLHK